MNKNEILTILEKILSQAKVGILATTGIDKRPHMRWMTPSLIRGRDYALFSVTSPSFKKLADIKENPQVEWMIQTKALDKIIHIRGKINILDNPSIKSEILEAIGDKLTMFWKLNDKTKDLIVLETIIEQVSYFLPMKGMTYQVDFTS